MRTLAPPTVLLRPSVVALAELRAQGPAAESVAPLVVDADVPPDACGLPRSVAIGAFWPLVVAEEGDVARVTASRAVTVRRADEEGVPVALRAHLADGEAVRVHPTVAAVLADGRPLLDVAVRGLWSDGAVADRAAMAPWRAPAERPHALTAGARLGLWRLTREGAAGGARVFANAGELVAAWEHGVVAHDAVVHARIDDRRGATTAGRAWLWQALPPGVRFATIDRALDAAALATVVGELCAGLDDEARWQMLAALDDAGSRWLARSGLSVCIDDLRSSDGAAAAMAEATERVREIEALYADGLITHLERSNKVIDTWAAMAERCIRGIGEPSDRDVLSSWQRAAVLPTARRAMQLVDHHGLMAKPSQEVNERPALGSAARGFDPYDAALIAIAGRATAVRAAARLDDTRDLVGRLSPAFLKLRVTVEDCGTTRGAAVCPWTREGRDLFKMNGPPDARWTAGRVLAEDVRWGDGALIAAAGTMLDEGALLLLGDARVESVRLRSPRTCEAKGGVCARCWGLDETGAFPVEGEAVGAKALLALWRSLARTTTATFHIC